MESFAHVLQSKQAKVVAAFLLLLALFFFNRSTSDQTPKPASPYDVWFQKLEPDLRRGSLPEDGYPSITLNLDRAGASSTWNLAGKENSEHIKRLLELAQEAGFFAIGSDFREKPQEITLTIRSKDERFQVGFAHQDIAQNIPAQNLLKLFEVYHATQAMKNMTATQ
jgi:hypothetical protein